jgi:hypothetical protein
MDGFLSIPVGVFQMFFKTSLSLIVGMLISSCYEAPPRDEKQEININNNNNIEIGLPDDNDTINNGSNSSSSSDNNSSNSSSSSDSDSNSSSDNSSSSSSKRTLRVQNINDLQVFEFNMIQ